MCLRLVEGSVIEVTTEPILPEAVINKVRRDAHGAVVAFVGTARDNNEGKKVFFLEYEAYKEMAEKKLHTIADEVRDKWHLEDVAISHRVGRVEIGEIITVIAVAAPHRGEAFEVCRYVIDRLKAVVPIWKKEVREDGEIWVGTEDLEKPH